MTKEKLKLTGTVSRCRWNHSVFELSLLVGDVIRNQNGNLFSNTKWYCLKSDIKTVPMDIIKTIGKGDKVTVEGIKNSRLVKDKNGWTSLDNSITITKIEKNN